MRKKIGEFAAKGTELTEICLRGLLQKRVYKVKIEKYFACPVCKSALQSSNEVQVACLGCRRTFPLVDDIPILLPDNLSDFKRMEAEYHTFAADNYAAVNMIDSLRVRRYHDAFLRPLEAMAPGGLVFEVAGGDGTDAFRLLQRGMRVVQTDISLGMVRAARAKIAGEHETASGFAVCDAENLPCKDDSLDGIMIVGALHHLPSPAAFFVEAKRVLKPGGILVIGFEPNTWQYTLVYPLLKKIRRLFFARGRNIPSTASIGDQETQGFSLKDFKLFAAHSGLEIAEVQRIWYANGFIHTFLGHYNAQKGADRQVDLPAWIHHFVIKFDNILGYIPFARNFCWHWSVVLKKAEGG
jgi:ubiquinone/menaquinone biosynthesis C-methylase UbiE